MLNRYIISSSCIGTSFCDPIFFNYVIGKRKHVSIYKKAKQFRSLKRKKVVFGVRKRKIKAYVVKKSLRKYFSRKTVIELKLIIKKLRRPCISPEGAEKRLDNTQASQESEASASKNARVYAGVSTPWFQKYLKLFARKIKLLQAPQGRHLKARPHRGRVHNNTRALQPLKKIGSTSVAKQLVSARRAGSTPRGHPKGLDSNKKKISRPHAVTPKDWARPHVVESRPCGARGGATNSRSKAARAGREFAPLRSRALRTWEKKEYPYIRIHGKKLYLNAGRYDCKATEQKHTGVSRPQTDNRAQHRSPIVSGKIQRPGLRAPQQVSAATATTPVCGHGRPKTADARVSLSGYQGERSMSKPKGSTRSLDARVGHPASKKNGKARVGPKFIFGIKKLRAIIKLGSIIRMTTQTIFPKTADARVLLSAAPDQRSVRESPLQYTVCSQTGRELKYRKEAIWILQNLHKKLSPQRPCVNWLPGVHKIIHARVSKRRLSEKGPISLAKAIRVHNLKIAEKEQQKEVPVFVRKMAKAYPGKPENLYIINTEQTLIQLRRAFNLIKNILSKKGHILFINTNSDFSSIVKKTAKLTSQSYINHKWMNGLLTNWKHIHYRNTLFKRFEKLRRASRKKFNARVCVKTPAYYKLKKGFEGLKKNSSLPDLLVVLNPTKNINAILEAEKLNIPVIGFMGLTNKTSSTLDSNRLTPPKLLGCQSTPFSSVSYPIFCNENSIEFIYHCLNLLTKELRRVGNDQQPTDAGLNARVLKTPGLKKKKQ